ncbi:hypothetical protein D3C73_1664410 [compost metagenome]
MTGVKYAHPALEDTTLVSPYLIMILFKPSGKVTLLNEISFAFNAIALFVLLTEVMFVFTFVIS